MHGHGIAGALWSAGRWAASLRKYGAIYCAPGDGTNSPAPDGELSSSRRITGRLRSVPAGIVALISLVAAAVCVPQPAPTAIITETFTGIVEGQGSLPDSAFYQALGQPIQDLNGDNFTLTVTADDTAGQQSIQSDSSGVPQGSSITNLGSSNPITAVLTVGGQSFSYGTLPNSIISSGITRTGSDSQPGGKITFSLSERSDTTNFQTISGVGGDDVIGISIDLNNPPIVAGTDWKAPLSYNSASANTVTGNPSGAFTFQRLDINTSTGQTLVEQLVVVPLLVLVASMLACSVLNATWLVNTDFLRGARILCHGEVPNAATAIDIATAAFRLYFPFRAAQSTLGEPCGNPLCTQRRVCDDALCAKSHYETDYRMAHFRSGRLRRTLTNGAATQSP